ncbi:MAG: Hsp70 family protein, partial [Romboutsia sp.]|nr:Hsp70 family protein [Romboutsia sp.]
IYTLAEPTAALIDYLNEEREKATVSRRIDISEGKKTLLVFDLGGGPCDVSIMEVNEDSNGQIHIQELSISQYTELGGVDFDEIVVNRLLLPQLLKAKQLSPMEIKKLSPDVRIMLQSNLKKIAENTKKTFTRIIKSKVEMNGENYFENSQAYDNIRHREMTIGLPSELTHTFEITKKMYDDCIKVFLYESQTGKDIETPIKNAIKYATKNITMDSIDQVFLVGGMTNYPTIQERIYEIFNKRIKPVSSINPMYSVSRGASVYNYYKGKINLSGPDEVDSDGGTIDVGNILPDNVYINVVTGDPIALLEKGTEAGSSRIIEDKFVVSGKRNQETISEMELELFSAESPTSMKITELESAVLRFRKPVKSDTKITIKAEYTDNREVIVSAWLKDDESEKIDVTIGESKISPEKAESIKKDDVK